MEEFEKDELIKKYRKSIKALKKALAKIPHKAWDFQPAPAEWSINQIILHLLDTELVSFTRARKIISHPGCLVMPMDADEYANNLNYAEKDVKCGLSLLENLVNFMTAWLETLPLEKFQETAKHPDYEEPYTLEQWLRHFSDHTYIHIDQINNNYLAWKAAR